MDDAAFVDVLDGLHDGPDQIRGILFVVVALGAYTIEQLTAGAQVEDKVEVVGGFEVIV